MKLAVVRETKSIDPGRQTPMLCENHTSMVKTSGVSQIRYPFASGCDAQDLTFYDCLEAGTSLKNF